MPRAENIEHHANHKQYESGDDQPVLCRIQIGFGCRYRWYRRNLAGGICYVYSLEPDGRDEAVAAAGNGFDEPGVAGIIPKSFSDLEYRHSQALIEFDEGILRPKSVPNLFPRNNLSSTFDKQ